MNTDAMVKYMVNRFLGWRLPKPWNPDNGISYARPNYAHPPADHDWPVGTNLFSATEAEAMVRYMLEDMPTSPPQPCAWEELVKAVQARKEMYGDLTEAEEEALRDAIAAPRSGSAVAPVAKSLEQIKLIAQNVIDGHTFPVNNALRLIIEYANEALASPPNTDTESGQRPAAEAVAPHSTDFVLMPRVLTPRMGLRGQDAYRESSKDREGTMMSAIYRAFVNNRPHDVMQTASPPPHDSGKPVAHCRACDELIGQRDHRDEVIDEILDLVLGPDRQEWSSVTSSFCQWPHCKGQPK